MNDERRGSFYILQGTTVTGSATLTTTSFEKELIRLWHAHLGHMRQKGMAILSKRGLLGNKGTSKLVLCDYCVFGKQQKVSFSVATHHTKGTLDYIHSNLWGPSGVPSFGRKRYMLTFIDDFSRKDWVYFLRQKNNTFLIFKKFKVLVEN